MIMPRGQQLLLPANPTFMLLTLLIALLLDMVQSMALFGNAAWTPDWVALLLLFWGVHQPLKVGVGVSFFLGLLTDVHQTSLLGQHALAYTVQGFLATMIHRRILWFDLPSQALQVFPVFWQPICWNWPCAWVQVACFQGGRCLFPPCSKPCCGLWRRCCCSRLSGAPLTLIKTDLYEFAP
jgi:rod shape-determining protein MreD